MIKTFDLRTKSCIQAIDDEAFLNWDDGEALGIENSMYIASQANAVVGVFEFVGPYRIDVHGHIVVEPLPLCVWDQVGILDAVLKLGDSTMAVALRS